ncbi:MAG: peptidoglycan editing factor PgeF, partial [Mariprofundaceae bacterium]|nr:peptidoglycan editing factor PgeF [Mariprofundaceae bacterium]
RHYPKTCKSFLQDSNPLMPESCFIRSNLFAEHGLNGVFSLRSGGSSEPPFDSLNLADDTGDDKTVVEQNMATLMHAAGLSARTHRARQVHGIAVLSCSGPGIMHHQEADILCSHDGAPLAVRTADCTPVLLADRRSGALATAHAGWRGSARGAVTQALKALQTTGSRPEDILAAIGPCIGPCCFEIGREAADALSSSCAEAAAYVTQRHTSTYADLASINRLQLLHSGVDAGHIDMLRDYTMFQEKHACTCCQARYFFSYRRDGIKSGRHLAIVAPMSSA